MTLFSKTRLHLMGVGALFSFAVSTLACRTGFECELGNEECPCAANSECNAGLMCSDGMCVPAVDITGSDTEENSSDTMAEGDADSGTAGDGDENSSSSSTSGDGDGDTSGETSSDGDSSSGTGDGDSSSSTGDDDSDSDSDSTTGDGDSSSSTGDGDGDGASDGTTGDGDCSAGFTCQAPIPLGWNGPVAYGNSLEPSCPSNWPATVHEYGSDPDFGSLNCGCECGDPSGVSCGSTVQLEGRNTNCFTSFNADVTVDLGECYFRSNIGISGASVVLSSPLTTNLAGASCQAQPSENELEPSFDTEIKSCGTSFAACDEGYCEPDTNDDFARVCIYAPGDVSCPAGRFDQKILGYEGFNNNRSCSACTCADPEGECVADVTFHNNSCQLPILVTQAQTGDCTTGVSGAAYITLGASEITDISCTPSNVIVQGSVEATGETTFCCEG